MTDGEVPFELSVDVPDGTKLISVHAGGHGHSSTKRTVVQARGRERRRTLAT